MARKRQRARANAKVAVSTLAASEGNTKEDKVQSADSGNDSPEVEITEQWKGQPKTHQCNESIKAWKCYQACILERYHWYLDKRKRLIAEAYSDRITQAYLHHSAADICEKTSQLQKEMVRDLAEVDVEESFANKMFRENIQGLEAGKPIEQLPLIDRCITLDQVSQFITKYSSTGTDNSKYLVTGADNSSHTNQKTMDHSFSSSFCSEDSGLLMPEKFDGLPLFAHDIWKPDELFTVDSFCQPFLSSSYKSVEDDRLICMANPVERLPNITDGNSELKAVNFSNPEIQLKDADLSIQPKSVEQPISIADDDSAIKKVIYSQEKSTQNTQGNINILPSISNWEGSLSRLSTEYGSHASLYQAHTANDETTQFVMEPVVPLLLSTDVSDFVDSAIVARGNSVECLPHKPTEEHERLDAVKTEANKITKSAKAPVKFVDCKTVGRRDQELVKEISFSWTAKDNSTKCQDDTEMEGSAKDTKQEDMTIPVITSKPTMSWSSVAKTLPIDRPLAVVKNKKDTDTESNVVFSSKQPVRKFPKSSSLNKTSICWTFLKSKKCPWGDDCIYAHGKKELRPLPSWFKKDYNPNQKTLEPPHEEPCNNHYCHWRKQYLLRKTSICKLWKSQRCSNSSEKCRFAHGTTELKPLPKLEMCKLFLKDKCNLKSTECVYAHHKSELRTQKSKKAKKSTVSHEAEPDLGSSHSGRLRTISETSNSSYEFPVPSGDRVRTISGTSFYSTSSLGCRDLEEFDWQAWNSQSDVPADEELEYLLEENECVICSLDFTEEKPKYQLQCYHQNFHQQCIRQWLEKDPTCPICRNPTDDEPQSTAEQWHLE